MIYSFAIKYEFTKSTNSKFLFPKNLFIGIFQIAKQRFVKSIKQVLQVLYLFYQKNTQHTTIKSDTLSVLFIGFFLPLPFQLPAKSLKYPLQTFAYHTLPYLLQQQPFPQAVLSLFQHVQTSHDFLNL